MILPLSLDALHPSPPVPEQWTVRPIAEFRTRYEQRANRDFAGDRPDSRYDLANRFRPGLEARGRDGFRAVAQYQYAHTASWTGARNSSVEASDLFLAFVEWNRPWGTATVGRQRIQVGSGRFVGSPEWGNLGRSMDGLRIRADRLDLYAFKLGVSSPQPESVRYFGAHYRVGVHSIGVISKHDKVEGRSADVVTLHFSANRPMGGWRLEGEAALQTGQVAGRGLEAWALHLQARRRLDRRTSAPSRSTPPAAARPRRRSGPSTTSSPPTTPSTGSWTCKGCGTWRSSP
jgi:hypothetical protein